MGDRKNIKTVVAWNTSRRTITLCKSNEKYFFLLFCCMTFSHFQSNENPFKMTQKKTENWFHYFWLSCFIVFVWHGYGVFFFIDLFVYFTYFLLFYWNFMPHTFHSLFFDGKEWRPNQYIYLSMQDRPLMTVLDFV